MSSCKDCHIGCLSRMVNDRLKDPPEGCTEPQKYQKYIDEIYMPSPFQTYHYDNKCVGNARPDKSRNKIMEENAANIVFLEKKNGTV